MSGKRHYYRLCEGYGCTANMATSHETLCTRCKQAAAKPKQTVNNLIGEHHAPDLSHGACVGEDPELFFDGHPKSIEEAKGVCRRCPLVGTCLEYAMQANHVGVWGGTDDDERRNIRRRAARAARAAS